MEFWMTFVSVCILCFISMLHMYWACGGRWGTEAVIPRKKGESQPTFVPGKSGTLLVAFLLLMACFLLVIQVGFLPSMKASAISRWGCIVCTAVFLLRSIGDFKYVGFFKKVKHSTFATYDTFLYSPLCLYLGINYILLLL
ncbi:DUF3995 domain-containing protein [Paenibacillus sp.]|jgi:hypothetical protein|uniref:DUF3995 domain-containing protein n=1 Tax=Paenibacillus sp. TaxID=58172 RepID=UPI002838924E|nr:DUF3995 domain-containing protein [Paenibacillus sp.]MDR0270498.1 DUF3995 domain-containing protein [Paenibacillus sp.]